MISGIKKRTMCLTAVAAVAATLSFGQSTQAGVLIDVQQVGGDVVATLSGSIDTDALIAINGTSSGYNGFLADFGAIAFGTDTTEFWGIDTGDPGGPSMASWVSFGSGAALFGNWDSASGDAFAMFEDLPPAQLGLPVGYVSGTALSAMASRTDTLAAMDFQPGTYVNTFTGVTGITDTITIQIGPVPAPGAMALFGICGLVGARRRR